MPQFVVPPNNYSVKMKDGTTYLPSKSGTINVENKRHAEEIRNSGAKKGYDMIKEKTFSVSVEEDIDRCPKCVFAYFAMSKACPRCGEDLTNNKRK